MSLIRRLQNKLQHWNKPRLLLFCCAGWIGSFVVLSVLLQTLLEPTITDEVSDKVEKNVRMVESVWPLIQPSQLNSVLVVEGELPPHLNTRNLDRFGFDQQLILHLRNQRQLRNPITKAVDVGSPGLSGYWVQLQPTRPLARPTWLYVPSRLSTSRWFWPLQGSLTALLGTLLGALAYQQICVNQPLQQLTSRLRQRQLLSEFTLLPERGAAPIRDLSALINRLLCTLNQQANNRHRLLRGIVHDLRGPLTRLLLRVERLNDPEIAAGIQSDLQAMRHLIDQLAALSSQQQPASSIQAIALDDQCTTVLASYPANAGIEVQVPRLLVRLNAQLLQRTLHNLIDNALEYGCAPIRLSANAQQEHLVIQVEDHGPGLSSYDQLPLPEQPQSHDRGHNQHSGLGLAIAERFCRDNGGSLHLAPSALGGLQVQLRLPASVLISAPP